MSDDAVAAAALRLRSAYTGGAVAPLREYLEPQDGDAAYAIQDANTRFWQASGRKLVGRKIGLTAKAVQAQLGVDQPDFGALFADMRIANGARLDSARVIQPKVEAEVAIVLGTDISVSQPTADDILAAIDHVTAAIEIVDSRIADWKISFADTVADNGSSAFFVLGDEHRPAVGLDLYSCGMVLEINGAIASLGTGAACLGHPLNAAAWLASTMAARGTPLRTGDILLTGALGPMVSLSPGDHVVARIGGIGMAEFMYGDVG